MATKTAIVQRLDVGLFTLIKPAPSRRRGKIWLERRTGAATGEAGEFSEARLGKALERFFQKHF